MNFSSATFLLTFLPVFLLVYYCVPRAWKNIWVLLASIFFYSWGAPRFIFLLLGTTLLDFFLVKKMDAQEEKHTRKLYLCISLILNLGLLAYFKYSNFFVENINAALSAMGISPIPWVEVVLPIGISFYTFESITYVVDVYRRVHKPLHNFWDYQLYIILFPKLIAGPIVRFHSIADQITGRIETMNDRLAGFYRFCIGLGKKILIANIVGKQADIIFNMPADSISTTTAWIGIVAYTMQIYFDFSGYSDMALGIGRMIGFHLPENFDNPYNSRSITEFWRRWHMTLGLWMKNYLYIPLGGNRVDSKFRLFFNLWLVFLVSGFWHGASWNFIIWGAFHGTFLILDRLFLARFLQFIGVIPSVLITFVIVSVGWVYFRVEAFSDANHFVARLFAFDFKLPSLVYSNEFVCIFILALVLSFIVLTKIGKTAQSLLYEPREHAAWYTTLFFVSALLFILSLSYITTENFNPFIYFRF